MVSCQSECGEQWAVERWGQPRYELPIVRIIVTSSRELCEVRSMDSERYGCAAQVNESLEIRVTDVNGTDWLIIAIDR